MGIARRPLKEIEQADHKRNIAYTCGKTVRIGIAPSFGLVGETR
jgi:hypothetical protein